MTDLEKIKENGFEAFGIFPSVYAGLVYDNNDPENLSRLKIKIPTFGDKVLEEWALPMSVHADKSGVLFIPQIGDNVWVQFIQSNIKFPIWSYGAVAQSKNLTLKSKQDLLIQNKKGAKIEMEDTVNLNGDNEQATLGNKLEDFMKELLLAIKNLKVLCGGSGAPSTAIINISQFEALEQKTKNFLSEKVKLS
ncbi:MAG: phage baseplate assembly protein V [Raineya sp.]|jgi:hypothetical protein|nr:phage baseplate assembly protein V [Raineya sp.]